MFSFVGRRNVFLVMILTITALMMQFSANVLAAPNSNTVEMSIDAGYEDTAKVGVDTPFNVTLVNKGAGFSGEVQVVVFTNYRSKMVCAAEFELPEGSTKKLTLNVPVYTANRKYQVRIESKGKIIKEVDYSFNKILPPEHPVIGVFGDAYNQLRNINGLRIKQNQSDTFIGGMYGVSVQKSIVPSNINGQNIVENPSEMFQLNKEIFPEDITAALIFDKIIIADYDTSLLSQKQIKVLEKWVEEGNSLIIAGGTNEKKVYSGLSNSLKPFEVSGRKKESINRALSEYTEKNAPEALVDVSTGNIGDGEILMGDRITPLVLSYKKGEGKIICVNFDPTMSPISTWKDSREMWKRLLDENVEQVNIGLLRNNNYYNYNTVVNQIPEDKTPPYKTLMSIILLYILLVGPILYIILKIKDKRDYSWVIVPLISIICLGIVYVAGFGTRYTSAVMNKFSMITLDSKAKKAEIQTSSGLFNNKTGKMIVEWPKDYDINIIRENESFYDYNRNVSDAEYKNASIKSKKYVSNPRKYELYDIGLWEPCVLTTSQTQSYDGKLLRNIQLKDNKFSVDIKNDTGFSLEESFIILGGNFVEVGDILPDDEKKISFSLDDTSIKKNYSAFLEARYPNTVTRYNRSKEQQEQYRKRNILREMEGYMGQSFIYDNFKNTSVVLVAFNYENVDYGIKVNGKNTKAYNTNIVVASEELEFESGKRFDIPKGLIAPKFLGGKDVQYENRGDGGIFLLQDGEVRYSFELPQDISVEKFRIDWSSSIPEYMKERYKAIGNESSETSYELFIFNNEIDDWMAIDDVFEVSQDANNYIDEQSRIQIKIIVDIDESSGIEEYLWKPEISLSGVKK